MVKDRAYGVVGFILGCALASLLLMWPELGHQRAYRALRDSLATAQTAGDTIPLVIGRDGIARLAPGRGEWIPVRVGRDSIVYQWGIRMGRVARLARLRAASREAARIADSITGAR